MLFGFFFSMVASAQSSDQWKARITKNQPTIGVGITQSLRPGIQLSQGTLSIKPVQSINFFLDYQEPLHDWLPNVSWGARVMFCFYKGWWDLPQGVSYYQPTSSSFTLEKLDQGELFIYLRKQQLLLEKKQFSWGISWQAGPAFSFNSHLNRMEGLVETRTDNGMAFQVCMVMQEKRQPIWLPFLRAGAAIDFIFSAPGHRLIIISPFLDIAAWHRDTLGFMTLPDDPANATLGKFKWNRNQVGCKISLGLTKNNH